MIISLLHNSGARLDRFHRFQFRHWKIRFSHQTIKSISPRVFNSNKIYYIWTTSLWWKKSSPAKHHRCKFLLQNKTQLLGELLWMVIFLSTIHNWPTAPVEAPVNKKNRGTKLEWHHRLASPDNKATWTLPNVLQLNLKWFKMEKPSWSTMTSNPTVSKSRLSSEPFWENQL